MQVAARMAEVASGRSWNTLFQERIKGPLGLKEMIYGIDVRTMGYYGDTENPWVAGGAR